MTLGCAVKPHGVAGLISVGMRHAANIIYNTSFITHRKHNIPRTNAIQHKNKNRFTITEIIQIHTDIIL